MILIIYIYSISKKNIYDQLIRNCFRLHTIYTSEGEKTKALKIFFIFYIRYCLTDRYMQIVIYSDFSPPLVFILAHLYATATIFTLLKITPVNRLH